MTTWVKAKRLRSSGSGASDGVYNVELRGLTWGDVCALGRKLSEEARFTKYALALENAVLLADDKLPA